MRRKIEKYLAKKQGCDESNIRYTEDGRFDLMGDLDGVLSAVRGKENLGKSKRGDKKSRKSSTKKNKFDTKGMPPIGMPPPYMPYGMPMSYPGMPPHPMYDMSMAPHHYSYGKPIMKAPMPAPGTKQETNVPLAPKPTSDSRPPIKDFSPKKEATIPASIASKPVMDSSSTPAAHPARDHTQSIAYLESSRKSIFDSPKDLSGDDNLGMAMTGESPALNLSGMTPLSTFKGAFATPYSSELFQELTLEENLSLNKALFADDANSPAGRSPRELRLNFCGADDSMSGFISDMRYSRVSISPVSHKAKFKREGELDQQQVAQTPNLNRTIYFADKNRDNELLHSVTKMNTFATNTAQTPNNITNITQDSINTRDIAAPSPFETSLTPIGDNRFWSRQLGFSPQDPSFTPFKSPMPMSARKERAPLMALNMNTLKNKPVPESENKQVKYSKLYLGTSPPLKRQRTTEESLPRD
jgi:hypothetical protein